MLRRMISMLGANGRTISSLASISNFDVPFNTAYGTNGATLGLPSTVVANYAQGGSASIPIVWSIGTYDPLAAFEDDIAYVMNGTLTLPTGVANPGNYQPSVTVTVKDAFYPLTSPVEAYYRADGLVNGVTNTFGTQSSGVCTLLKSRAPGPLGRDLVNESASPAVSSGSLQFSDAASDSMKQPSLTTVFDYLYKNSTPANLKHTTIFIMNPSDNGAVYGVWGNNGIYAPNGGMSFIVDTTSTNNKIGCWIFNPAGGGTLSYVWTSPNGGVTIGAEKLITVQCDFALADGAGRVKSFNNTTEYNNTGTGTGVPQTIVAGDVFTLGDGRTYGGGDMPGFIKAAIFLSGVESAPVLLKFQQDIIAKFGIS